MESIPLFQKIIIIIFQAFIVNILHGQDDIWVSYSQKVDIKNYEGDSFRLSSLTRIVSEDDAAYSQLWARVDKVDGEGFFDNMWNQPIRNIEWKKYSINGIIDSGGYQLAFGVVNNFNGKFFFDDIKLEIKSDNGKWKNIHNLDFEENKAILEQGVQAGTSGINTKYTARIVSDEKVRGNHCLVIEGIDVPVWGVNSKVGRFADVNGIKLYYEIYGQGPPLIVLHGNGGSIQFASPFYADLIKNYKVVAVDSRAHGKSEYTGIGLTYEQMASDVNALLDHLQIDSAFIWGHSDGAILGLILAMDYPKKVKKLLAFAGNVQRDTTALYPWLVKSVEKVVESTSDPKEKQLYELMLNHPNIPYDKLSEIKAPVLIMVGDRDGIKIEHTVKLFQKIPNSHLCILPGTTHMGAWEKRELFLLLAKDFFNNPFEMPDTRDWFKDQ